FGFTAATLKDDEDSDHGQDRSEPQDPGIGTHTSPPGRDGRDEQRGKGEEREEDVVGPTVGRSANRLSLLPRNDERRSLPRKERPTRLFLRRSRAESVPCLQNRRRMTVAYCPTSQR